MYDHFVEEEGRRYQTLVRRRLIFASNKYEDTTHAHAPRQRGVSYIGSLEDHALPLIVVVVVVVVLCFFEWVGR